MMYPATQHELNRVLAAMTPEGAVSAVRSIAEGDENFLTPAELAQMAKAALVVRRASGAARHLARHLMAQLGTNECEILRDHNRAPVWPGTIVGAISHDRDVAVAILAARQNFAGLGIDVEPAEAMDSSLVPRFADTREQAEFCDEPYGAKMLFAIKEAVFKAVPSHDGRLLNLVDIHVDRHSHIARTSQGHVVNWRAASAPRVLAVAWWS